MTWSEAKQIARGGTRIRRMEWTWWLRYFNALWWFDTTANGLFVVKNTDFQAADFMARDWTTDDYGPVDPCARPGATKPVFNPPPIFLDGSWNDGTLTLTGGIGEGSAGAYVLSFLVDGELLDFRLATGTAKFTITAVKAFQPKFAAVLRVESALPLEPWTGEAQKTIQPSFSAFDFAVIRYGWDSAGGSDLDTRTALVSVDASVDGVDVGWSRSGTVAGVSGNYLSWGGDNTSPTGTEAVVVDFPKIATDFPALTYIRVRLRANWYGSRASGNFALQFATYLGGAMSASGTDFINTGGTLATNLNRPSNVTSNVASNVDGEDVATLTYHVPSRTAVLS